MPNGYVQVPLEARELCHRHQNPEPALPFREFLFLSCLGNMVATKGRESKGLLSSAFFGWRGRSLLLNEWNDIKFPPPLRVTGGSPLLLLFPYSFSGGSPPPSLSVVVHLFLSWLLPCFFFGAGWWAGGPGRWSDGSGAWCWVV